MKNFIAGIGVVETKTPHVQRFELDADCPRAARGVALALLLWLTASAHIIFGPDNADLRDQFSAQPPLLGRREGRLELALGSRYDDVDVGSQRARGRAHVLRFGIAIRHQRQLCARGQTANKHGWVS